MRSISQWWQGTKAFALIRAREEAGLPVLVEEDQAERRAAVCLGCPHNALPEDVSWAEKWANGRMRRRTGGAETPLDDTLGLCRLCSCELRTIVHFEAEVIRAATGAEALARLPAHCWKRKEQEAGA